MRDAKGFAVNLTKLSSQCQVSGDSFAQCPRNDKDGLWVAGGRNQGEHIIQLPKPQHDTQELVSKFMNIIKRRQLRVNNCVCNYWNFPIIRLSSVHRVIRAIENSLFFLPFRSKWLPIENITLLSTRENKTSFLTEGSLSWRKFSVSEHPECMATFDASNGGWINVDENKTNGQK